MTLARLLACLIAVALAAPAVVRAQAAQGAPIVVVPFDNPTQDPRLGWLREGAAILLSEMLVSSGDVVTDREERLQAFDRLQLPANAVLSRASIIKVGQVVTASMVVGGTIAMQGDQLIARARGVRIDTGRLLSEVEASGAVSDLYGIFGRLAQQVRGSSGAPRSDWRSAAAGAASVRVVRQGTGRGYPVHGAGVSRADTQGRAAVRSRSAGNLGHPFRGVGLSQGARRGYANSPSERVFARRALPACAVADEPEAVGRRAGDTARAAERTGVGAGVERDRRR